MCRVANGGRALTTKGESSLCFSYVRRFVTTMKKTIAASALLAGMLASTAFAAEGPVPTGVPPLNHVFLIMMENHGYSQIINNPNAPFTNYLAGAASLATNYFAVGHPSLTNYLEV